MANRIRNERLEIKLTKEEKALFEEKRKLAKCRNMSHFIRKCVLEKEIYQVDLEPFRIYKAYFQMLQIISIKLQHAYICVIRPCSYDIMLMERI